MATKTKISTAPSLVSCSLWHFRTNMAGKSQALHLDSEKLRHFNAL